MPVRRSLWWVFALSGFVVALVLIALLTGVLNRQASATPVCPTDWGTSLDPNVTLPCSAIVATAKEAADALYMQTAIAHAALNPQSIPETRISYARTATPGAPLTAPLVQVAEANGIDFFDGPEPLRRSQSIWHLGLLPGHRSYVIDRIYILTHAPENGSRTLISIVVNGADVGPESWPQYNGYWEVPQEMGIVRITAITNVTILPTGLTGTASFTTSTGGSGTFDLATHTWTITAAGTPVVVPQSLPNATPTAGAYPAP